METPPEDEQPTSKSQGELPEAPSQDELPATHDHEGVRNAIIELVVQTLIVIIKVLLEGRWPY